MKSHNPSISIVMPIKNAEKYIDATITSILNQTFGDYELILINDNSTDSTIDKIQKYKDERITLITSREGYISALNLGLQHSSGKYIARMDADDYMHPDRLRLQFLLMERLKDIDVCGSWARAFNKDSRINKLLGKHQGYIQNPLVELWRGNFLIHPSIMLRADFVRKNSIKYSDPFLVEDYDLWVRLAVLGAKFYIIPQCLIFYQVHENQSSNKYRDIQINLTRKIQNGIEEILFRDIPNVPEAILLMRELRDSKMLEEELYRCNVEFLLQSKLYAINNYANT